MSDGKVAATKVEVHRLLDVGFIREVQHPSWLANIVKGIEANPDKINAIVHMKSL
jgi:hypothetical protein